MINGHALHAEAKRIHLEHLDATIHTAALSARAVPPARRRHGAQRLPYGAVPLRPGRRGRAGPHGELPEENHGDDSSDGQAADDAGADRCATLRSPKRRVRSSSTGSATSASARTRWTTTKTMRQMWARGGWRARPRAGGVAPPASHREVRAAQDYLSVVCACHGEAPLLTIAGDNLRCGLRNTNPVTLEGRRVELGGAFERVAAAD